MTFFKKIANNKIVAFLLNRYVLILLIFTIWMLFFDENSWLNHLKLDQEIEELQNSKDFYETEIDRNTKMIETLENPEKLERFAREKYNMKKDNEELFLIEYDTIE